MMEGVDLYILTGPTAVGKTELSLQWAEAHGAEIISCDSLLFYRGMNIGTAKPSKADLARVPHHLIDVAEPAEAWNVQRYLAEATRAVEDVMLRGKRVLVTGGSGFYLKAFFAPIADRVEVPEAVAREVEALDRQGLAAMVESLLHLDPEAGESLDMCNPRRVRRALERVMATGKPLRQLQEEFARQSFPFSLCRRHLCLLTRDRDELRERVVHRVDAMLEAGLVDEVRSLLVRGLEQNPSAASAIGYREVIRHLHGETKVEECREEIIQNTQHLIKKQLTWFRHQLPAGRVVNLTETEPTPGILFEENR
jgi:tRNA dimethylallyltransferase